jgi:ketosteroid isomerase-like protein
MARPWPDDLEAFVAAYLAAWNAADIDRICDAYADPAPIYQDGAVVATGDPAARRAYLAGYVDAIRAALAAGARWESPEVGLTRLGPDSALATVRWVFRRPDGTVLEDYPDTYLLVRIDGRWAYLADVIHPAGWA